MDSYRHLPDCEDCHGNYWQRVRREDYNGPTKFVRCGLCGRVWVVDVLVSSRLDYLRAEIRAERISWGELAELASLADDINPSDAELREWAGVDEHE